MDDTAEASIEPTVSTLRYVEGSAQDTAAPLAGALAPPAKVARGRQGERLLFFFDPTGAASLDLSQGVREVVAEAYWSTVGSVTAALRRAASLTNQYLFEHNLNSEPSRRCYGGLSCAVVRQNDLFLLQAGPAWACVLQLDKLRFFPRGEKLAHLGIGPVADVRLNHVFAANGDTLLMASPSLLREAGKEGLLRVLSRDDVSNIVAGLGKLGTEVDFTALVARWQPVSRAEVSKPEELRQARGSDALSRVPKVSPRRPEPIEQKPRKVKEKTAGPKPAPEKRPSDRERRMPERKLAIDVGEKLRTGLQGVGHALEGVWHAIAAVGAGAVALGRWLLGAAATTVRSMLPGARQKTSRRVPRRPPPEENRTVLIALAVAIPVLVIAIVTVSHLTFAVESRVQGVLQEAREEIALAQAAGSDAEEARSHWKAALRRIETAEALQPDDPSTQALREQARHALDELDQIQRLTLTRLVDFGSKNVDRRLVLGAQALFVLDSRDGWGVRVGVDRVDEGGGGQDAQVLVRIGQPVEEDEVEQLVDCAWVAPEGGRQSSGLLILERDGGLVSYDPAWGSESGAPQLARLELSAPLPERPLAVGTYEGQFYVLDGAESGGQIWRYRPQGNAYPRPPEPYFATLPDGGLQNAVDMAIDGHIYVLHEDGTVRKFLGGELQPFEVQGVPGGLGEIAGFAVDPGGSGVVYVADRGNNRIVELHADGRFKAQFRADGAFEALEAVAVGEGSERLYVLDEGQLYAASLP
jgi:hypothetical protein